ncbi:MAG: hypothetical protein ABI717_01825 [Actinomycetota bacterium]
MKRIVLLAAFVGALGAAPTPHEDQPIENYGFKVQFQPGAGDPTDGTWKAVTRGASLVEVTRPVGQLKLRIALRPCLPQVQCDLILVKSNKGSLDHLVRLSASIQDIEAVSKLLSGLDLKSLPDDDCVVTVTDEEEKPTTFNFIDCFPTSYSIPDVTEPAESNVGELHVKVHRVELA